MLNFIFFLLSLCPPADAQIPAFRAALIDTFPGGYSVCAADMNGDGLTDIVGLSTNPPVLAWYRNPGWERRVITTAGTAYIDCAPHDIDGDGRLDIALQSDFRMNRTSTGGLVTWLRAPADPQGEWRSFDIWAEPTCHRIRWADVDGDGADELVNAPIMGRDAVTPDWAVGVRLAWFEIPANPETGPWVPRLIDDRLTVLHGIFVEDWDGDGRDDLLTASFEGVHIYFSRNEGGAVAWEKVKLGAGEQADSTARGASEVAPGRIKGQKHAFIATVEPWHGNEVVVYTPPAGHEGLWERNVIETAFDGGHGLTVGDLNNDGTDEIIAGYRGGTGGLYIYTCTDSEGKHWKRTPLDEGGITVANICTADLNGDGRLDIIAIGAASGNIKLYENLEFH